MTDHRTITIVRKQVKAGQYLQAPQTWVVRVDGQEFTHGHNNAMEFDLAEDAARFAAELKLDYGPETVVELAGLDALGVPLDQPFEAPFKPEAFGA